MNIFSFRDRLIADYAEYAKSFMRFGREDLRKFVEDALAAGALWPEDLARLMSGFPPPRQAVAYIMDTFPIVKRKDREKFGSYRTKDTILEVYDAMSEAIHTGCPYQTRLDPPPADPKVRHPERSPKAANRRIATP